MRVQVPEVPARPALDGPVQRPRVTVHIGTVEVRAIRESRPEPPRPSDEQGGLPPPKLTLAGYMRKRDGGMR